MKLHLCLKASLASLALIALGNTDASAAFKVIGYMPSWSGSVSSIQYSKLTHINYAFLIPKKDGSVNAIENSSKLKSLVSTAHSKKVKVLISVGGWNDGDDSAFRSFAASSTGRTKFTNTMLSFVSQYNLDGVDIDWEYPDSGTEPANYTKLMTQLSSALHAKGKLLTCAVVGNGSTGNGVQSAVFSKIDSLNIMAYDANNYQHSTYTYATQCISYWVTSRGCPASKATLGVPFYSRPSDYAFSKLLSMGASANSDTWNGQGYNGIPTIKKKTNFCFDKKVGGIMMWELSEDATGTKSLLSAIHSVVLSRQ